MALAISRDGNVVAGSSNTGTAIGHTFRWTAASGMTDLGVFSP